MVQQDLRNFQGYMLGVLGLVMALFIPFAYIILRLFQPLVAALLLGVVIPLIALILAIIGLSKSSKQSLSTAKTAKILNIITIIISVILILFSAYAFIKSGGLA
jgi:succinate dehydrogenase hydrophobic anchor subunit